MARPIKKGLDYFPLDVDIDINLELIEAEHGLEGFAIVIKLWQKIYSNGYYIDWDDDSILLFSKQSGAKIPLIETIVDSCFKRKIFNKKLFNEYKILTSSGIQKRYLLACGQSKRKRISFITEFTLVNSEFTEVISEFTDINSGFSTQRKGKESKGKNSIDSDF